MSCDTLYVTKTVIRNNTMICGSLSIIIVHEVAKLQ